MMQFDEFIQQLDGAIRASAPAERTDDDAQRSAQWAAGGRRAAVALVPPLNVSVTLDGSGENTVTNWYPVDAALVPVVSKRIAGFLSEA